MSDFLNYKGYYGSIEVSIEDNVLHGKILFINDLVTYEANNVSGLKTAFQEEVDDYIAFCAEVGKEPEKPFRGTFNVRIDPELHKKAAIEAVKRGLTLNQFVSTAISNEVDSHPVLDESKKDDPKLDAIMTSVQTLNQNFMASTAFGLFSEYWKSAEKGEN